MPLSGLQKLLQAALWQMCLSLQSHFVYFAKCFQLSPTCITWWVYYTVF